MNISKILPAAGQTDKEFNMQETLDLSIFHELDIPITISEIENSISESEAYKSPGFDNIINEFFKTFSTFFSPLLQELFNVILYSGFYQPIEKFSKLFFTKMSLTIV